MTDIFTFSLEAMRSGPYMGWLEERRDEFSPLLASSLKALIEGKTFVVFCDDDRAWFENYVVKKINGDSDQRPLLPFFSLKSLYPNSNNLKTKEEIMLLDDMLSIAFPNGVIYFYIGKGSYPLAQMAKLKDDSYMWLIDEHAQNSFYLKGDDEWLDIKLIQMITLFNQSIDSVLFNEVVL